MSTFRNFALDINKELSVSLQAIMGVGWHTSNVVLSRLGIPYPFFHKNVNNYYLTSIVWLLKGFIISDARIKRRMAKDILKLIDVNCYKGSRHTLNLPVHGQRTRTNASTQRQKKNKQKFLME